MSFIPSETAIPLWNRLMSIYHETGRNEFDFDDYLNVPNHDEAIKELVAKGALLQANSIVQQLSTNSSYLK